MSQIKEMKSLSDKLEELHSLLAKHEVKYATVISPILTRIKSGDINSVNEFLGYYGGMGSLNDLVICAFNKHKILKEQEESVNEKYLTLLYEAQKIAKKIQAST